MDPELAVIVGAAIAFAGTIVGTAVTEWLRDRRERSNRKHDSLRASIETVLALAAEESLTRESPDSD
jgi:hypothetical protein